MRILAKILVWLAGGGSGDRSEINLLSGEEAAAWSKLSSDSEDCSPDSCAQFGESQCPYYNARQAAETSHIVIVNHALLLADITTGNRVIPEYDYLIIDEAHHLESATTRGLSFAVTEWEFNRYLKDLGTPSSGILQGFLIFGRSFFPPEQAADLDRAVQMIKEKVGESSTLLEAFFEVLKRFLALQRDEKEVGPYGQRVRIQPSTRTLPEWSDVEISWDQLRQPLGTVIQGLHELSEGLLDLTTKEEERAEDLVVAARAVAGNLQEVFEQLDHLIFEGDPKTIYWLELSSPMERVSLHAAPLEIGYLVEKHIWHEKEAVVVTSATLTTAGNFDYIRQRLNAFDAEELFLGSPFDYENAALLYLVNDIPEPIERHAYQRAVERGLIQLCKATRGRSLILFTSFDQLRRTARAISDPLASKGILVFEQGEGASRHSLLETFRTTDQAVLLGTRSFWEGVDVPGQALSALVIIRLPFDVPSDPIIAARSDTYELPFEQYSLPEAILRFRQGFGRLIRTKSDRGVVAIFDKRVISKSYGHFFVDSLPQCTVRMGPMRDLPETAARWLGD
jgi:DNA polymerase-3 subunit epsilon/ATP-dependent DNA helicase DinG